MFYYYPWLLVKHLLALEAIEIRNVVLTSDVCEHTSMTKTQLEGTWEGLDSFGLKRDLHHLDPFDTHVKTRKPTKWKAALFKKKPTCRSAAPVKKTITKQAQTKRLASGYDDGFCLLMATRMRHSLESRGHSYPSLSQDCPKTAPKSPILDEMLEKLWNIEKAATAFDYVNSATSSSSGIDAAPAPGTPSILETFGSYEHLEQAARPLPQEYIYGCLKYTYD